MLERFTEHAKNVVACATQTAFDLRHNYIGTEHLLIGLISAPGVAAEVLRENGVEKDKLVGLIHQLIAPASKVVTLEQESFTPRSPT